MKALNYIRPSSVEDAYQKLMENDKNVILSGGLWLKRINSQFNTLIDLADCDLNHIKENDDEFIIGSMVTLRELELSSIAKDYYQGVLADAIGQVMGVPLRNSATIGGTIMGRFAFSDIITPLLALDVTLEMYPSRMVSLKDFLKEKRSKEILTAIHIKKLDGKALFKKVKLTELGFAILNIAVSKINDKYAIVVGARPGVASLASKAMELVNNNELSDEIIAKAGDLVMNELTYLDSNGNSKDYRAHLARVYFTRFLKEIK